VPVTSRSLSIKAESEWYVRIYRYLVSLFVEFVPLNPVIGFLRGFEHLSAIRFCWGRGHKMSLGLRCCYCWNRDISWASHLIVVSILPVSGLILGFPLFCCLDTPSIGTYLDHPTLLLSRYSQYRDLSWSSH